MARRKQVPRRERRVELPWRALPDGNCHVARLYGVELGVCSTATGWAYQIARGDRVLAQARGFSSGKAARRAALSHARLVGG